MQRTWEVRCTWQCSRHVVAHHELRMRRPVAMLPAGEPVGHAAILAALAYGDHGFQQNTSKGERNGVCFDRLNTSRDQRAVLSTISFAKRTEVC